MSRRDQRHLEPAAGGAVSEQKPQREQRTSDLVEYVKLERLHALADLGDYFVRAAPEIGTGLTGPEIAKAMGCSENAARKKIKEAMAKDILEHVTVQRQRIDGRTTFIVGYRLKHSSVRVLYPNQEPRQLKPGKKVRRKR